MTGLMSLLFVPQSTSAAISSSGSVSPAPPQSANADPVIGISDIGRFTITPSSVVNSDVAIIGRDFTGIGYAVVSGFDTSTGSGAVWNTNNMVVGSFGTGTLEIVGGGLGTIDFAGNPASGDLSIGLNPDSVGTVVVSGRGSLLRIGDDTNIGHNPLSPTAGSGTLIIEDEGFVVATNDAAGNTDVITIGLHGRIELNNGRLRSEAIINNGTIVGHGRIDNEQTVLNQINGHVGVGSGERLVVNGGTGGVGFDNDGEVSIVGGELEFLEQFTNSNQAAAVTLLNGVVHFSVPNMGFGFDSTGGVLASTGGVNDIYGTVRIQGASSRIVVAGESTAVFHEPVTNSGSTIEVFPGSTAVYLQGLTTTGSSAALAVHLADAADEPDFGSVEVAGGASLDGTVNVQLAIGFIPVNGDTFQILSAAGGVTGSLALGSVTALPAGLQWELDINATSVLLSVVSSGDYNGNGVVDAADYVLWRKTLNQSGPSLAADGNANGSVDVGDFDYWRARFGTVVAPAVGVASGTAVPEPATAVLALLIAFVSLWQTTPRQRSLGIVLLDENLNKSTV
jgi:T5SS/PEP-CTERM-associated repeat protein